MRVGVVGAGLSGLACAQVLQKAGVDVTVYEASDGVGGRVRSDLVDGFTLDRGFQVLFTAYPAARRLLNYAALDLRAFEPGARIAQDGRRYTLSDPFRDPAALIPSVLCPLVSLPDKLRAALLGWDLQNKPELLSDTTAESFLFSRGFSENFLANFARPFFGSIFLDRSLQTSAQALRFVWRMLASGQTVIPARGMGAISAQLADGLDIKLQTRVEKLADIQADAVVLATPAPEAARLAGLKLPGGSVGVTTLYFAGDAPLWRGRKILLNANPDPLVSHAAMLTNVAPEYAPSGQHLLSISILGVPNLDQPALFDACRSDLARMLAGSTRARETLRGYRPLALYKIPYAQFLQPPGFAAMLPKPRTNQPNVFLAGEFLMSSSIDGALASGEACAHAVLESPHPPCSTGA